MRIPEDRESGSGFAMPEFPGYTGPAVPEIPVIKVKAITTRKDPIFQTCIGPSEEHTSMAGIPTEASILSMVERAMPGKLKNVYCSSTGGGKHLAVLQFCKSQPSDEGRQRQAALLAFSAFSELKHVFLVDEDVDPFDMEDVLWAMNTRFQRCGRRRHPRRALPSARSVERPSMSPSIAARHSLQDHLRLHRAVFRSTASCGRAGRGPEALGARLMANKADRSASSSA
ncbi:MAG: UbiD family decarboxylase domain-containing protein [Eggerthellaceae bacterium]